MKSYPIVDEVRRAREAHAAIREAGASAELSRTIRMTNTRPVRCSWDAALLDGPCTFKYRSLTPNSRRSSRFTSRIRASGSRTVNGGSHVQVSRLRRHFCTRRSS